MQKKKKKGAGREKEEVKGGETKKERNFPSIFKRVGIAEGIAGAG